MTIDQIIQIYVNHLNAAQQGIAVSWPEVAGAMAQALQTLKQQEVKEQGE